MGHSWLVSLGWRTTREQTADGGGARAEQVQVRMHTSKLSLAHGKCVWTPTEQALKFHARLFMQVGPLLSAGKGAPSAGIVIMADCRGSPAGDPAAASQALAGPQVRPRTLPR